MGEVIRNMPEADYFAHPALSNSDMKLLMQSPAKFAWQRTHPRADKKAFDIGHAAHSDLLGTGMPIAAIPDEYLASNGAASTAKAKEFIADARALGKVPLKASEAEQVRAMADAVRNHPTAGPMFRGGHAEDSVFWTDEATGVECRARLDYSDGLTITDLKTTDDANPKAFGRNAFNYGYHTQQRHYREGLAAALGVQVEDVTFRFVQVEKAEPYMVSIVQLDDDADALAAEQVAFARQMFRDCTESGVWPGYPETVTRVSLPAWAERQAWADLSGDAGETIAALEAFIGDNA